MIKREKLDQRLFNRQALRDTGRLSVGVYLSAKRYFSILRLWCSGHRRMHPTFLVLHVYELCRLMRQKYKLRNMSRNRPRQNRNAVDVCMLIYSPLVVHNTKFVVNWM